MKALLTVLTLALFVAGTAFPAIAAPELSLSSAEGSAEVLQGQSAVLNLSISGGTEAYAGVNAKITLPQGITVSSISKGTVLASGFTADWYVSGTDVAVIAYSTSSTFSSGGVLFTLNFQVGYTTPAGDNAIAFVSDASGLSNPNALSNADGSKSIVPTVKNGVLTVLEDIDKDGLWDEWEKKYFGNLSQGAEGDPDRDGIKNIEEYNNGTDPNKKEADVDKDGLPDDWEIQHFGNLSQEANGDPDGDGYTNLQEYQNGTDPNKKEADVDKDGLSDDWEMKYFGNLNETANGDPDNDGVSNLKEQANQTDPTRRDTFKDAIIILKFVSGLTSSVTLDLDTSKDKKVGLEDATIILQRLVR